MALDYDGGIERILYCIIYLLNLDFKLMKNHKKLFCIKLYLNYVKIHF